MATHTFTIVNTDGVTTYLNTTTQDAGVIPSLFGVVIDSVTYAGVVATINGHGFGDIQYPVSKVEASNDSGSTWPVVGVITQYGDGQVKATMTLSPGTWIVRVTGSDNVAAVSGEFAATAGAGKTIKFNLGLGLGF